MIRSLARPTMNRLRPRDRAGQIAGVEQAVARRPRARRLGRAVVAEHHRRAAHLAAARPRRAGSVAGRVRRCGSRPREGRADAIVLARGLDEGLRDGRRHLGHAVAVVHHDAEQRLDRALEREVERRAARRAVAQRRHGDRGAPWRRRARPAARTSPARPGTRSGARSRSSVSAAAGSKRGTRYSVPP